MSARRVTTVTVPVQARSGVAFEAYRDRTPLLTIWATRPALLVTLTLPERIEPGHVRLLETLGLTPYLELGMRLGEGTGAALGIGLLRAALACYREMATFTEAKVSERLR